MHGITATGVKLDLKRMLERKDDIVGKMTAGIEGLFKKNKITWLRGRGSFVSGGTTWKLEVAGDKGSEAIEARNVIIATGSKARALAGIEVDNRLVCDNEGALAFEAVPEASRGHRRRRDRAGAGQRVAAAGRRGDDPGGAAELPRRCR